MDLALNNLQRLICHKNPTNQIISNKDANWQMFPIEVQVLKTEHEKELKVRTVGYTKGRFYLQCCNGDTYNNKYTK